MATAAPEITDVDAVAERTVGYLSGAAVSAMVHLGDQLGLYRTLADHGPATSSQLAATSPDVSSTRTPCAPART